jgi:hypothetical protein
MAGIRRLGIITMSPPDGQWAWPEHAVSSSAFTLSLSHPRERATGDAERGALPSRALPMPPESKEPGNSQMSAFSWSKKIKSSLNRKIASPEIETMTEKWKEI